MSAWPCLPYIDSRLRALADGRGALQGHAAVEKRRRSEAEQDVESVTAKLRRAQRDHDAAAEELKRLNDSEGEAVKAIKAAAAAVQRLSRQQLDEVRSLAQPPVVVKRALSLVHALLHPEEISQEEPVLISDWERLSAMLRRSLLQQVASFPPPEHPLVTHPHVRELIAAQVEDAELQATSAKRTRTSPTKSKRRSRLSAGPATARGARLSFAEVAEAALSERRRVSAGDAELSQRRGSEDPPVAPRLTQHAVSFSCRPVGILFRWLVQQIRFAEALLLHEENAEREEKKLRDAEAAVGRIQEVLARLRSAAEEAKARSEEARSAEERLGSELKATEQEERQLRKQRDDLQKRERRMSLTAMKGF